MRVARAHAKVIARFRETYYLLFIILGPTDHLQILFRKLCLRTTGELEDALVSILLIEESLTTLYGNSMFGFACLPDDKQNIDHYYKESDPEGSFWARSPLSSFPLHLLSLTLCFFFFFRFSSRCLVTLARRKPKTGGWRTFTPISSGSAGPTAPLTCEHN